MSTRLFNLQKSQELQPRLFATPPTRLLGPLVIETTLICPLIHGAGLMGMKNLVIQRPAAAAAVVVVLPQAPHASPMTRIVGSSGRLDGRSRSLTCSPRVKHNIGTSYLQHDFMTPTSHGVNI